MLNAERGRESLQVYSVAPPPWKYVPRVCCHHTGNHPQDPWHDLDRSTNKTTVYYGRAGHLLRNMVMQLSTINTKWSRSHGVPKLLASDEMQIWHNMSMHNLTIIWHDFSTSENNHKWEWCPLPTKEQFETVETPKSLQLPRKPDGPKAKTKPQPTVAIIAIPTSSHPKLSDTNNMSFTSRVFCRCTR